MKKYKMSKKIIELKPGEEIIIICLENFIEKENYSISEFSKIIGRSGTNVKHWIDNGKLEVIKNTKPIRICASKIDPFNTFLQTLRKK